MTVKNLETIFDSHYHELKERLIRTKVYLE